MSETIYLTVLDIEAIHVFIMDKTGDPPTTLRDRALLESATMRPQMAAFYDDADLIQQCALLLVGISQARAFVDGNKRTALMAGDVFLRINGLLFSGDPLEVAEQIEMVASRNENVSAATNSFAEWLRGHVSPKKV